MGHGTTAGHTPSRQRAARRWLRLTRLDKTRLGIAESCLVALLAATTLAAKVSKPGGAGHALLFNNHALVLKNFKGLDTSELTFEAWVSTTDTCHSGTLMSYALDSKATDNRQRAIDYNHFFIANPHNLLACHDFEWQWIGDSWGREDDYWAKKRRESCAYFFNYTTSIIDRTAAWHHVAVTWTAADEGSTKIYRDGLLMAEAKTKKTNPIKDGGALVLGAEQDCYGGCTEEAQSFYGLMDEVRIWRVARSQEEIMKHMRNGNGLEKDRNLVAYWKFDDPDWDVGLARQHVVAKDSSMHGNHLPLITPPLQQEVTIQKRQAGAKLVTGSLHFDDNYALAEDVVAMPDKDFSIEFWAKTGAYGGVGEDKGQLHHNFLTYSTHSGDAITSAAEAGESASVRMFEASAIRIEKVYENLIQGIYGPRGTPFYAGNKTSNGSIMLHINGNPEKSVPFMDNWLYFDTNWLDEDWHHVAVTWEFTTGLTTLYFDGEKVEPYAGNSGDRADVFTYHRLGDKLKVDARVAAATPRSTNGSLVLGQNQLCHGGCFSPEDALRGELANVRIWKRVVSQEEIKANMFVNTPEKHDGLTANYLFNKNMVALQGDRMVARSTTPDTDKRDFAPLYLWADAPRWEYSLAPLVSNENGKPVENPEPGDAGTALQLNDQQVLMTTNFHNWPDKAITVEFWMWSVDGCREGAPISYATDDYAKGDNMFGIFNYNNWQISVAEDEGHSFDGNTPPGMSNPYYLEEEYDYYIDDDSSGVSATDGTWHHIAVTWESSTGVTNLYDNGRLMWSTVRAKGKTMQSGGTLIVGREQDCKGGCFDSGRGAVGPLDMSWEHGAQDFYGIIDELRIWRVARTPKQIFDSAATRLLREGVVGNSSDTGDLAAYWSFDEGKGYVAKDRTGNGHDLYMSSMPQWQVVRWASTCGDGVVEGLEECDVGNNVGDKGCSATCKVVEGWDCSATSPSRCWKLPAGVRPRIFAREKMKAPRRHVQQVLAILGILTGVLLAAALAVAGWHYRENLLNALRERDLGWRLRGKPRGPIEYEALLDGPDADADVYAAPSPTPPTNL